MRPSAVLALNLLGLLVIWGLLETPRLAAWTLIAIGLALPVVLAYEARLGRLDKSIPAAAAWWSAPFVASLGLYLIGGSALACLAIGVAASLLTHLFRVKLTIHNRTE
ncbi:MAG TPA: hypothetical protein VM689_10565 [Aliidongia sp.]|nr:hypothetical protein [Aliidongia sp.]